jgi:phage N-6-adenine-methyltransferase
MTISRVLFSSKDQTWGTPPELFEELQKEFGPFQLDAATRESNPLRTPFFYTEEDNGLEKPWIHLTYCNPPYGKGIYKWVQKAYYEQKENHVGSVMLIPARTDTRWFHDFIYKKQEYRFLKGRLRMVDYDTMIPHPHSAPFPSMIVIFRV